jgi:hypothetical protein
LCDSFLIKIRWKEGVPKIKLNQILMARYWDLCDKKADLVLELVLFFLEIVISSSNRLGVCLT